jgi:hypothetical protein
MKRALTISATLAFCATGGAMAGADEDADNFMQIHKIEIAFHEAGSTKNLDLMMSLFTDDANDHSWRKDLRREGTDQNLLAGSRDISTAEPVGSLYPCVPHKVRRARQSGSLLF